MKNNEGVSVDRNWIQSKFQFIEDEIRRAAASRLGRNAGWMLIGQGLSFLTQAAYFIILARLLGVKEYGVFAGAFAFVAIVTPYSSLGSGLVFVKNVGADHSRVGVYWGNIILSTAIAGSILAVSAALLAPFLLNPESASIVLFVAIANCIFSQLVASMCFMFQTFELLKMTALLTLLTNCLRLAAVVLMTLLLPSATAKQWAISSVYISIVATIVGLVFVKKKFGGPRFSFRTVWDHALEGLGFSLGWSAQSTYNDIDKTLLSHYGMNVQNGIYSMAYRIVDVATIPIGALDAAALPRYVHDSAKDIRSVRPLAVRLATRASLLGLLMSVSLFIAAPLIPHLVGPSYAEGVLALRWLCLLPAMRGIHQLTGCALTGMGYQRFRTVSQLTAAGLNLVLNLWLIPRYGWIGAAWTSLATDGSLAVANWLIIRAVSR